MLFGWAAGPPEPVDAATLLARSASVVTPAISDHIPDRDSLEHPAADVFRRYAQGFRRPSDSDLPAFTGRRRTRRPATTAYHRFRHSHTHATRGAGTCARPRSRTHPIEETFSDVLETRNPHARSEEHTSELQSHHDLVCRLLLEKKKKKKKKRINQGIIDYIRTKKR